MIGFEKKDMMNAKSASIALKDIAGETIEINGIVTGDIVDNEGEKRNAMYLKGTDGSYYCSISATCMRLTDDIESIIEEEGSVKVKVVGRKAKSGRDFISLIVL